MSVLDRARREKNRLERLTVEKKAAAHQRVKEQANALVHRTWGANVPAQLWRLFEYDATSWMDSGRGRVWTKIEGVTVVYVCWWHGNPGDSEALFGVKRGTSIERVSQEAPSGSIGHHRDLVRILGLAHLAELVDSREIEASADKAGAT